MQDATKRTARARMARLDDAPQLQRIYAPYVEDPDLVVSFETVAPDAREFERRIRSVSPEFPYLVCEEDGEILGYAYAHRCFERAAYRWCAETTVYVSRNARGRGVGTALYGALIELLATLGYRNLYAVVVSENVESCRFHENSGFRLIGVFERSGWKFGRWLDVSWYERSLNSFEDAPSEPLSIQALPMETIDAALRRADGVLSSFQRR